MSAEGIIADLHLRGIRLSPEGDGIAVEPASRLTDVDRTLIRTHKHTLLAYLKASADVKAAFPGARALGIVQRPANRETLTAREGETQAVTPDSRHPRIQPEVRAKIEAIEPDARAKGWGAELLWNQNFWDTPRGLAAVLEPADEIAEVASDCITILRHRRDVLRFRRHVA